MQIKAIKLWPSQKPQKTELYEISASRNISVEERQEDGSLDQVILEYRLEAGDTAYFAKEYRPGNINETGAKKVDITAVALNHVKKRARWHLYDMKGSLAGRYNVVQLYNQWNCGLRYLQQNVLDCLPGYSADPDLGVFARSYDEERMKRLRDEFKSRCEEAGKNSDKRTLAQRKKRTEIAKDRAVLTAAQAILDRSFRPEDGSRTYEIHIRKMPCVNEKLYKAVFPV